MTVMVALLRAVNVGGRGGLAMADLRAIAADLGYGDVATYIQSGNLVLSADEPTSSVAPALAEAIASTAGIQPAVVVRTVDELAAVVHGNPFAARGEDRAHLHVVFTDGRPADALTGLDLASYSPEEVAMGVRELYLLLPGGVGRSRLASVLGRSTSPVGTVRSWRTVTTLLAMAEAIGT